MSGHNKWSTIKHRKGAQDKKRGRIFTKVIKEITIAARLGGGDPDGNPRLRRALDAARAANMPNDTQTRAIKKGTGELEGVHYEDLIYEGVGPGGTLFIMEVMTDNRNRTAAEVRKLFEKGSGQLGATGSAAWAFEQKGIIKLPLEAGEELELFEKAAGAGAEDLRGEEEEWVVTTAREDLDAVSTALEGDGLKVTEARLEYIPNTPKEVEGDDARKLVNLFEALEEHDDIQTVFADFELSEAALAELESED
ncbi:MAG: YebC/PmpR family DNA-binding transcriptional regulator [Sandaracinus sp.]|nr:YebC/PmpR family DNA-binding transcriptional regulator [Sandaracinus sp.]|tara:strand:+ start:1251 stop:2006 length:756 start_codon:yes stop_codon:yes gene_type:complete